MHKPTPESVVEGNLSIEQLTNQVDAEFERRFGGKPAWIAAAPGRVNLIGEHTDYNDGFVLPMAIERYTLVAARRNQGSLETNAAASFQVYSSATDERLSWPPGAAPRPDANQQWINYVWGVLAEARKITLDPGPLNIVVHSSVPVGGGLSSSAALEVATATMLEAATGRTLDPVEKALLCQKAEHDYAGMPCGIMDQFSSVMGRKNHLILLDCQSARSELVPLEGGEVSILIINSNVKHELTGSEYPDRRRQCESAANYFNVPSLRQCAESQVTRAANDLDPILLKRARHVTSEIGRTTQAAAAFRRGDWPLVGELMYASHASLRDDYEVSCEELDLLVEFAREIGSEGGVYGSRMTGGGFGGCTVSLVRAEQVETIAKTIHKKYEATTQIEPTVLVSRPAAGAFIVRT